MKGLYVVAAVTMAGVSSVFALLAEIEKTYDIAQRNLGWIAGSAFVGALITQLWLARYADRGYGQLLLRAGIIASAAGLIWFGLASDLAQFVAARALLGAGVGVLIPAARRAIILQSGGQQGERLGTFYGAYLAGFVFGPPIAGALTEAIDLRAPFLVLGAATALTLLVVHGIEVDGPTAATGPSTTADADNSRVLRRLLSGRKMIAALLVVISFRYSVGVFEPLWAPHLDNLGASTRVVTLSLTGFALPMLLVAKRAGRLSDQLGARYSSVLSALLTVPLMASYGWFGSWPLLVTFAMPHGLLEAVQSPGSQTAVADAASDDDAAAAQGLAEAAGSVAAMTGALTAAPLYDALGAKSAWGISALVMLGLLTTSAALDRPRRNRPAPAPTLEPGAGSSVVRAGDS